MKYLLIFYFFLIILPRDAHAYLDPGSGSYIIQVFLATALGAIYIFKEQVLKVVRFVKNLLSSFFSKKAKHNEK